MNYWLYLRPDVILNHPIYEVDTLCMISLSEIMVERAFLKFSAIEKLSSKTCSL
jgi:hypothetical protein